MRFLLIRLEKLSNVKVFSAGRCRRANTTTTDGIAETSFTAGVCRERSATNARSAACGSWPQGGIAKITVTDHPTEPF